MGLLQQHYRDCEYGLVVQIDHKEFNLLMFVQERILQLMAMIYLFEQMKEFYLMDLFQQRYHDCECGLEVLISHMESNQSMFNQVHI